MSEALIKAARKGDLTEVKRLLYAKKNPAAIDFVDDEGYTALIWAADEGHLDIVKEILATAKTFADKGASVVNHANQYGYTALIYATLYSHLGIIKEILKAAKAFADEGASVLNHVGQYGYTALILAAQNGHLDIFKEILKAAQGFADKGASVLNHVDQYGYTALTWAAQNGHKDIKKILLQTHRHVLANPKHREIIESELKASLNSNDYKYFAEIMMVQFPNGRKDLPNNLPVDEKKEFLLLFEKASELFEVCCKIYLALYKQKYYAAPEGKIDKTWFQSISSKLFANTKLIDKKLLQDLPPELKLEVLSYKDFFGTPIAQEAEAKAQKIFSQNLEQYKADADKRRLELQATKDTNSKTNTEKLKPAGKPKI